jgi:hypothetical protein
MDSGGSGAIRRLTFSQAFPCQMAGPNDYNFGKTGGKGLNRLE